MGARIYRIIADTEIDRDLDVSRRDWAAAIAEERSSIEERKAWIDAPD